MKANPKLLLNALLLAVVAVFLISSCKDKDPKPIAEEYQIEDGKSSCECDSLWFPHDQTPPPKEDVGSPFDARNTTNCIFQQWSWQKFLWVTKPDENGLPNFLSTFDQVDSNMETPTLTKLPGTNLVLTSTAQAGGGGILKTNPVYNAQLDQTETVYYGLFINDSLRQASDRFRTEILDSILPNNNSETFPVGSVEIKSAWVNSISIPYDLLPNYYTTMATVQKGTTVSKIKMALLGIHVVGVVINHPEFIWATFEHKDIAPTYSWDTTTVSSSAQQLLFGVATTSSLNGINWDKTTTTPNTPNQAFTLFEYGIPRVLGGDFMLTSESGPVNHRNMSSMNECVNTHLKDVWSNYFFNGAMWLDMDQKNHEQQVHLIDSLSHTPNFGNASPSPKAFVRGSVSAANISMETFEQTHKTVASEINVGNLVSCFYCHSGGNGGISYDHYSPLYISHIFNGFLNKANGASDDEITAKKLKVYLKKVRMEK